LIILNDLLTQNSEISHQINFSKTLYDFNDFESNSSNSFYLKEPEIEVNSSKKYILSVKLTVGDSLSGIQPVQYFGFEELDENGTHINGSDGTYTYLLYNERVEAGDYELLYIIGDDVNITSKTRYIRPIILSNYNAGDDAVITSWKDIKIEELHYNDIEYLFDLEPNVTIENKTLEGEYGKLLINDDGSYTYLLDYKKISNSMEDNQFLESFDLNISNLRIEKVNINIYNLGYNPKISLKGFKELYLQQNFAYRELGAVATDIEDGDISYKIKIDTSSLELSQVGDYKVYYTVIDSSNLEAKTGL